MFKLNVLTPERKAVFDQEITEVSVPAHSGEMTILPGHAPMITTLGTGILRYKAKNQEKAFKAVISWGYCEVSPEGVNVLAEFLQTPEETSAEAAQAALQTVEKKLTTEVLSDSEYETAMNEAEKARAAIALVKI
ncbi:ATP synthase F1 subunit epsilon [Pseudobdellovibrio exovorus]|uniref:ATP synthase epsilon chain n=1 Tax=Pseudobdellovibrio exovorus JSS TaxID=1184267 RepID=M4VFJ0_9BACT|nr:ATP synthase F1 subunit epsilon [Pseudobdellovibrio exovorus]AGH96821.1 ATP synthase epsilon subunit [Pseudobdellovibrio exovorus JSS]